MTYEYIELAKFQTNTFRFIKNDFQLEHSFKNRFEIPQIGLFNPILSGFIGKFLAILKKKYPRKNNRLINWEKNLLTIFKKFVIKIESPSIALILSKFTLLQDK